MTAAEPPVRGDHRTTWRGLAVVAVLFLASVACALLLVEAYRP